MEESEPKPLPVTVNKPTPYNFDLGFLLCSDPNPLPAFTADDREEVLAATARDGAQVLINQLLTTCPITSTENGVLLTLTAPSTRLPREKPLPTPKPETTWQKFARKKGIKAKTKDARQNLVFDESTQEWVPKWGYKGANKKGEQDWIVEVDMDKEKAGKTADSRMLKREERKEKMKRQERRERANDRKGRKSGN